MTIDIRSFRDWQEHMVTKALYKFLSQEKNDIKEAMSHSHVIFDDKGEVRNATIAKLAGRLDIVKAILELEYENLEGENKDEKI